jgi:hypothetical protein
MSQVPAACRDAIIAVRPDLAAVPMVSHDHSWDSLAIEAGESIFKFPKDAIAEERLRGEARYLALIRERLPLPVPDLRIHEQPVTFSEHRIIPGRIILTADYARLTDRQRDDMAARLAGFYAALHAIPLSEAEAAGVAHLPDWSDAETALRFATPFVPEALHPWTHRVLTAYEPLRADPDRVPGYFDGHGWNMAFDHDRGILNGVFDFADGGIGPRQQDFCYGNLISADLTDRTIAAYTALTGHRIDRRTVMLHTAVQKIVETEDAGDTMAEHIAGLVAWHDLMQADPELAV